MSALTPKPGNDILLDVSTPLSTETKPPSMASWPITPASSAASSSTTPEVSPESRGNSAKQRIEKVRRARIKKATTELRDLLLSKELANTKLESCDIYEEAVKCIKKLRAGKKEKKDQNKEAQEAEEMKVKLYQAYMQGCVDTANNYSNWLAAAVASFPVMQLNGMNPEFIFGMSQVPAATSADALYDRLRQMPSVVINPHQPQQPSTTSQQ
ncbi:unnamed protein product, partial [Mesorhabditis spiculigera]